MSSKKGDLNLMIPGADGWEIWTGSNESGFRQKSATGSQTALEVTGIPSGPIQFAVPVRQVAALPFRAQTNDLALLDDLAALHLEKNGTRPALDGGQLSDHFVYEQIGEETLLTAVVMTPPNEGQLPRRSPEAFDISPRCYPLTPGNVIVWRELGRWVFGIGKPGQSLYFQCLSGEHLDDRAGTEVRLALTQLQIQGLVEVLPQQAVIWANESASDARPEEIEAFSRGLGLPVHSSPKPAPTWPIPPSRLLPADVRAERLQKKGARNRNLLVAALVLAYLGAAAFLYLNLKKAKDEAVLTSRGIAEVKLEAEELTTHLAKWDELTPVVESDFHPFDVLLHAYRALPNDEDRFIRLTEATMYNQFKEIDGSLKVDRRITLKGLTTEENQTKIPDFTVNLKESEELSAFDWSFPPEKKDKKSGNMTFVFEGNATR